MTAKWKHSDDLAVVDREGRTVILDLSDERGCVPRVLEGSARHVWSLIDGQRSTAALIDELAQSYNVQTGSMLSEVESFLGHLAAEGLIRPVSASDTRAP